jgi:aldose 1-epimerase
MTDGSRLDTARKHESTARDRICDKRFLLVTQSGIAALVSTWGAGLVALHMPDRKGLFDDVVLGFDSADEYAAQAQLYFGCTVGRVANRIRNARFRLGDSTVTLAANDGRHHIHGGTERSFDKVAWTAEPIRSDDGCGVVFRHVSPHLEGGYPGRLEATVTYRMTLRDELRIDYQAQTDRTTPVSFTNHTYWNLSGAGSGSIVGHVLEIAADRFTATDNELIPTGAIEPVAGTALDFRTPHVIGSRISELEGSGARGYDHNYVLSKREAAPTFAARLRDPSSGRIVEVLTDQPCLQFYSGNFMAPTTGKFGARYGWRSGACLEAQRHPDAVNNPTFDSVLLHPGGVYRATTIFTFATD